MEKSLTCDFIGKNSKEAFLKKLQICMKNYDYKDETKDVRGKVSTHLISTTMLIPSEL